MYFLGIHVDHAPGIASFVILEKHFKNVRHFYTVQDARQAPAVRCRDEITAFYNDGAYTIRKRVFSQDQRPKKDVSARPTIVLAAGENDLPLIETLRAEDVPVEAVFLTDGPGNGPAPEPARAGIGKNHRASALIIYETLTQVLAQKRLSRPVENPGRPNRMLTELDRMLEETSRHETAGALPDERPASLLTAAAVPIWFRENVHYTSVYRTSATSIRKYK